MNPPRDGRIATIDGLRGIAILLVVWFHVWQITWQAAIVPGINLSLQPLAETGFIGVAIFFFISGFVLLLPYATARETGAPAPSLRHFVLRRFFKIVPSYVLCIGVLLALGTQAYPNLGAAVKDVSLHLLFVHNWFAATTGSIDGVLWSLGAEVQFYVIFPLIAVAFVRRPVVGTLAMLAVACGWRAWCLLSDHYFIAQRLQQMPAYLDLFAAGMLCACVYAALVHRNAALTERRAAFTALSAAGFALLVFVANAYYVQRFTPDWPHPAELILRPLLALACFAIALGGLFAVRAYQRVLANRALLLLAAVSYNLYLWHQPIARFLVQRHVPQYAGTDPHLDVVWQWSYWLVAIPAVVAVGIVTTYGFERPILRWGKRFERRRAFEAGAPQAPVPAPIVSGPTT